MRKKKRNSFWTFCFSFIPGAVEMYMGFMKMGLSLMSLFFAVCFITAMLNVGPLLFVAVIAWFYGFFHARNMAGLSQEELDTTEDTYLLDFTPFLSDNMKNVIANQKAIAWCLVIVGIYLVWQSVFSAARWFLPWQAYDYVNAINDVLTRGIFGAAIIYIGYRLIKGKKMELFDSVKDAASGFADVKGAEEPENKQVLTLEEGKNDGNDQYNSHDTSENSKEA